jgi:ABC-type lipoprotein export system ATPase subunit
VLLKETWGSDSRSSEAVLEMIDEVRAEGTTIVMATHDASVAARMHRQIRIHDGRLLELLGAPR